VTGFFRGPSLMTHVFIAAAVPALAALFLRDWLGTGMTLLACLAGGLCYGVGALLWASWRR
jgi:hypothetical protein